MHSSIYWVALGSAILANILSNICLRQAARQGLTRDPGDSLITYLLQVATNQWLISGILIAAVLFACYVFALRGIPLFVAYASVTSLAMVGIMLSSALFLGDVITAKSWIGMFLVIGGMILLNRGAAEA